MTKLQRHHITYDPEHIIELTAQMHKLVTTLQITKATEEQYARITNLLHAIVAEWNRIRAELDTGLDLRIVKQKDKR